MQGRDLNRRAVESLIRCGAFDGLGNNRREMLMAVGPLLDQLEDDKRRNIEAVSYTHLDVYKRQLPHGLKTGGRARPLKPYRGILRGSPQTSRASACRGDLSARRAAEYPAHAGRRRRGSQRSSARR